MTIYEALIKCFTGQEGQEFSRDQIIEKVLLVIDPKKESILPTDFCYNRINNGINFKQHLFEYLPNNSKNKKKGQDAYKFKYLGPGYPYSGPIQWKPKGKEEETVGFWEKGRYCLWKYFKKVDSKFFCKESQEDILEELKSEFQNFNDFDKTERESIIKSRIGQGIFREKLISFWKGRCSVTGLSNLALLKASHIKPWRMCNDKERLDVMNGLLLHPLLDQLFDLGFITFEDNGKIRLSRLLSDDDIAILNIDPKLALRKIPVKLMHYMQFHREVIFKK